MSKTLIYLKSEKMGDTIEISTYNFVDITNPFYKVSSNALSFEVKGYGPVFVGLAEKPSIDVLYWLGLDDNRRLFMNSPPQHRNNINDFQWITDPQTNYIISPESFTKFWIMWDGSCLQAGEGERSKNLRYFFKEQIHHKLLYVTFVSQSLCHWKIELPPTSLVQLTQQPKLVKTLSEGHLKWVRMETNGELPDESVIGGWENGESQYIIRGPHQGSLTPGKFVPSEGVAYICWGGRTHVMDDFEVLQGYNFQWTPSHSCEIPKNAFVAGYSEIGDPLFVGRVHFQDDLIVGKVHATHKLCYLPIGSSEISSQEFEILTVPGENIHVVPDNFVTHLFQNLNYY